MDDQITHLTEVITSVASSLIAAGTFFVLRCVKRLVGTVTKVEEFMEEDRLIHRANEADHDLLFDHLSISREQINARRREAIRNGGHK